MHVRGIIMDLNWLLQFIFTVFVIGLCWLHLVKNTASKNFEVNDNIFEAAESNHAVFYPSIVNQAMEAEEDSFRCVNCGNFGIYRCSRCKSERYCSQRCQIKHWKAGHRLKCKDFRENSSRTANSNSKPIKKRRKAISPPMYGNPPTTVPVVGHQTSAEAVELAMEINGSIQSTKKDNPLHPNTHKTSGVINPKGWEDPVRGDSHNGWGATVASTHSAASSSRWMDQAPKEDYNGWGVPNIVFDPNIVKRAMEAEEDSFRCVTCGNFWIYRCSRCKSERYCSQRCQIKHWKAGHRLKCKDFRENSSQTAKSNSKPIKKRGKVIPPPMYGDPPTTVPVVGHQTSAEAVELAMAINGSIQSTKEDNPLHPNTRQSSGVINPNGWEDPVRGDSHNRWGATVASTHSAASSSGWMDEAPKEDYNRWGVPNMGPSSSQGHVQTHDDIPHVYETSSGNTASVSSAPSAPPIPDWALDEGPIHDPSIDFCPVDLSVPAMEHGASVTSDVNEGGTSSCIICWEAPVECACIPCGHMAGCMTCLSEIKAKKGVCPVCRSKINQVVRLYAV